MADGSLDRKLEEETQDSLAAAEAALVEVRAKVDAAQGRAAAKPGRSREGQGRPVGGPRRRGKTPKPTFRASSTLLRYTQIRAPYDGVVTERNVNRGDFVQPAGAMTAKPLLSVARMDVVRIFVEVPERESPWVEAGRMGYVEVRPFPTGPSRER